MDREIRVGDVVACPHGVGTFSGNVKVINISRNNTWTLYGVFVTDPEFELSHVESFWRLDAIYVLKVRH